MLPKVWPLGVDRNRTGLGQNCSGCGQGKRLRAQAWGFLENQEEIPGKWPNSHQARCPWHGSDCLQSASSSP